jgi:hypothetical protein
MTRNEARRQEAAQRPPPSRPEKPSSIPDTADPSSPRPDSQIRKQGIDAADPRQHQASGRRPLFGS